MSHQKEMDKQKVRTLRNAKTPHRPVIPNVDIFEDQTGITIMADLPGVSKEGLDIQIDNEVLSIDGCVETRLPEGMNETYAEFRATRYQRSFSLSNELEGEKVEANLKDGVLSMRIPKRQEYQPRKIEIRTG